MYIFIYTYIHTYTYTDTYKYIYIYIYTYIHTCFFAALTNFEGDDVGGSSESACRYYMYVCVLCLYVCIYIYI